MCLNLTEKVGLYIYKGAQRRTSLSCALHVASIFYASDLFLLLGIGDRMTALPMEGNGICVLVKIKTDLVQPVDLPFKQSEYE